MFDAIALYHYLLYKTFNAYTLCIVANINSCFCLHRDMLAMKQKNIP